MKIIATTLGETMGDFFSMTLNLGYVNSLVITFVFFFIVLMIQLSVQKFIPVFYWLVIIGTTTFGTEISDLIDRTLHLGYTAGSLLLFTGLVLTLIFWKAKFKNLAVYPIIEKNKEICYWIAVLFSNSLGTAFGDYLNAELGLSYLNGAMVTAGIILFVVLLHYATQLNKIVLFWIAFIFTRPFGATFGDFLTKPVSKGGMDLGTLAASIISIFLLTVLILFSHYKQGEKKITRKNLIRV